MRKSLIVISILLALSLGILVSAVTHMDAQHENITVTETTLYGDPAAAEGLTVSNRVHSQNHLFWDTTYAVCADPNPETVFTYSDAELYEPYESEGSFDLYPVALNCGFSGHIVLEEAMEPDYYDHNTALWLPVKDVADRTSPGEEHTETVRLADYYQYFPVDFMFNPYLGFEYHENAQSLYNYLNRLVTVPVPEELKLEVTICKDEAGEIYNVDYWEDSNTMYFGSSSAVLYDGVFFGLFGQADFSQLPQGYGIYYIPVAENDKITAINGRTGEPVQQVYLTQRAENIYPMDPADCQEGTLVVSQDRQRIYAFTKEQGEILLTVFDGNSREILQQLKPGIRQIPTVWQQDNVLALVTADDTWEKHFLQIYLAEDGELKLWLDTELFRADGEEPYWYMGANLAFDGRRLAIAQYQMHRNLPSHRLLIYEETGLQYAGDFHHCGDDLPNQLHTWETSMQLHWQ